jgi:hypothetical protein
MNQCPIYLFSLESLEVGINTRQHMVVNIHHSTKSYFDSNISQDCYILLTNMFRQNIFYSVFI